MQHLYDTKWCSVMSWCALLDLLMQLHVSSHMQECVNVRHVWIITRAQTQTLTPTHTHLIDCLVRFALERWTEYERKSKDAACLSLSWKKNPQNDTGSIHPTEKMPPMRRGWSRMERLVTTRVTVTLPFCRGCGGLCTATCCSGPGTPPSPL